MSIQGDFQRPETRSTKQLDDLAQKSVEISPRAMSKLRSSQRLNVLGDGPAGFDGNFQMMHGSPMQSIASCQTGNTHGGFQYSNSKPMESV